MPPTIQDAHLDLLLQVNRLLTEADKARVLRDRLMAAVEQNPPIQPPPAIRLRESEDRDAR